MIQQVPKVLDHHGACVPQNGVISKALSWNHPSRLLEALPSPPPGMFPASLTVDLWFHFLAQVLQVHLVKDFESHIQGLLSWIMPVHHVSQVLPLGLLHFSPGYPAVPRPHDLIL